MIRRMNEPSSLSAASVALLAQDDAIPGNRKDGFRFHYLIFVLASTPVYLWLELSFGVRLLDHMSSVGSIEQTDSIEHWGRLISGLAVSLLFLAQWFGQCEKWNRPWPLRLGIAAAICLVAVPLTWILHGQVIDFYVANARREITLAIPAMLATFALGLYAIRRWLKTYGQRRLARPVVTVSVLVAIVALVVVLIYGTAKLVPVLTEKLGDGPGLAERLGEERQQAALLSLIRRGMQMGAYTLWADHSKDFELSITNSPEGKAALAMFPVVGAAADQSRFVAARPAVLKEVMYADWEQEYGEQSYTAFTDMLAQFFQIYRAACAEYESNLRQQGGEIASDMSCLDCRFRAGMSRSEFTYELFSFSRRDSFKGVLDTFEDQMHFAQGRDGENAARSYWVPIWALLFSMIGAFTHIFKLTFTFAEYAILRAFHRVRAADSQLADQVVTIVKRNLIGVMLMGMLFIYFFENRMTEQPAYKAVHARMFEQNHLIGGLIAHWTINAQGLLYPFTRKITPE